MIDVDVLSESYLALKQYIPSHSRQEAADSLMGILVDMLDDEQLKLFGATDSYLTKALKEFIEEDEDEDYNSYDDE